MISQGYSAPSSRLEALQARHAALSRTIESEMKMPATDALDLRKLKLEKLKIKEEIEMLRKVS